MPAVIPEHTQPHDPRRCAGQARPLRQLPLWQRRRWGFPCCVRSPCANMPSPLPRWDRRRVRRSPCACDGGLPHVRDGSAPTSNVSRPARRSLALRPAGSRGRPRRPFPSEAPAVSLPPLPLRLLPAGTTVAGWELHPLKIDTFARRTLTPIPANSWPIPVPIPQFTCKEDFIGDRS
jgi:hypothetical protein